MRNDDELERAKARRQKTLATGSRTSERTSNTRSEERSRSTRTSQSRQGVSSNKSQSAKKAKKRRRRIIFFGIEAIVLVVILIGFFIMSKFNKIQRLDFNKDVIENTNIDKEVVESMKGYTNFVVFGVDGRDGGLGKGVHADVDMIVSINNETGEIRIVSLYRDTYLNIKNDNYNKLTQAYFEGGPEQAVAAINKNLDLNITDYAVFNWSTVADCINILGGVDVDLTEAEFYYINAFITETVEETNIGSVHLKKAGPNHLDGIQAVAYARLRKMDTDYQRTERQRKIIELAMDKAKVADWSVLNNIMETVFPRVATSLNIKDVIFLARNISKYHIGETTGFPFEKNSKVFGKKGDCVFPLNLEENVKQLHTFLFESEAYTPSSTVKKISKKIAADYGGGGSGKTTSTKSSTKESKEETKKQEESSTHESGNSQTKESESTSGDYIIETTEPVTGPNGGPGVSGTKPSDSTQEVGPGVPSKEPTEAPSNSESSSPLTDAPTEALAGSRTESTVVQETIPSKPTGGDSSGGPGA